MMAVGVEFIEATLFTRSCRSTDDDEYAQLQQYLANDPEAGDVIPGSGGFRKVRWGDPRRGRGRRGGLRVIYYLFLTPDEKRLLKAAADEEKRQRAKHPRSRRR
jgi:hypothetical protein